MIPAQDSFGFQSDRETIGQMIQVLVTMLATGDRGSRRARRGGSGLRTQLQVAVVEGLQGSCWYRKGSDPDPNAPETEAGTGGPTRLVLLGPAVIGVIDGSLRGSSWCTCHPINLGHKRRAHLAPGEHPDHPHDKTYGFWAALSEAGVPHEPGLVCHPKEDALEREVQLAIERLLAFDTAHCSSAGMQIGRCRPCVPWRPTGGASVRTSP